jgi:hypothetical protein
MKFFGGYEPDHFSGQYCAMKREYFASCAQCANNLENALKVLVEDLKKNGGGGGQYVDLR